MSVYQPSLQRDTLRYQLLKWVVLPMVVLLLLNVVLTYKFGYDSANRRHDRFLIDASAILLDQLVTHSGNVQFNIHSGALSLLSGDSKDKVYYFVGGLHNEYQFGASDLPLPHGKLSATPNYYQAEYNGQKVRMVAAIFPESDVPDQQAVVIVAKTLNLRTERVQEWIWRILPAQFLLIVAASFMLWWGVGRGLRTLLQMRDEVTGRSLHDLQPLNEEKVVAEIRPLISGFNQLLGRLESSIAVQKRFIADAAHQLRTPIAGLKAQAELAIHLDDPAEMRHSLQQIHRATEQTSHLVQQLLALARAEPEAQSHNSMLGLDLVTLAQKTTGQWVNKALDKNIDLGFESKISDPCHMFGNPVLLTEMLNNLIDNALRYTPNNGQVTVRVQRESAQLIVEVEDNGIGIEASLRERVFERFYRVLGSDQTGCGLGLAIVREIVTYHAGQIIVLSGINDAGSLFRVNFPAQLSDEKKGSL
jgi:two-component system sensor histidine kinase TctE